jgi:hypothetical protein
MRRLVVGLSIAVTACGTNVSDDPQFRRALAKSLGVSRLDLRLLGQDSSMICGEVRANGNGPLAFFFVRGSDAVYVEGTEDEKSDPAKFGDVLRSECPNGAGLWRDYSERHHVQA